MRLLVTGGAGYIGAVVSAQLLEQGHEVVVLDNLSRGHRSSVPQGVTFIEGDVTNREDVATALRSVDGVLHFAALSLVGESVSNPAEYWRVNVGGTQTLLDLMRVHNINRFVFSSTAATYGDPNTFPITEESPTQPTNPYGASKLAVDHMISSYCKAYGLGAFSLRYFNVAGAHGSIGERHEPETHLIPNVLRAVDGKNAVKIFGNDWPTPDGTPIRDYIHVTDLGKAHIAALSACTPGKHEVVNLGSGSGSSVLEVITAVEAITGKPVAREVAGRREGDPAILVASNEKAAQVLNWRPELSLNEMVRSAWEFMELK